MKWKVYVINQERLEKLIVKQKRFYFPFNKHNMEKISRKLFVNISVGVFPNEISIRIGGLSQVDCPPRSGWAFSYLLRPWPDQKAEGEICHFFLLLTVELEHLISFSPAFRLGFTPLAFVGLQSAESRSWVFSASINV